jgi:hypothetical protein
LSMNIAPKVRKISRIRDYRCGRNFAVDDGPGKESYWEYRICVALNDCKECC